ncbi:glycerol-3-phosphate dehydrogenase, putative [Perkinsus marinus ATCC 50983]|uniref:glycerol-3-phosphate dehydrogenase (NAD(+)) n=1 Tax=Perkinsus marinus (strain ATCC 50983 / TXsc) TaxID=423536 RepID=C5KYJ9_PERM5|nr:glycerol-3-phosphate dehydrogenase, putative [Perkinsus marinus ATCC 50983]EER10434.1 glycerol-3-phosphate dehydrogenase, putative [Perkinsus marinus ATCC 50983]|eukprot:XP_002778639.1 glycerol-3-phosphate dehydrogenase, putative [Perkinsus marinus ATCC 50983]
MRKIIKFIYPDVPDQTFFESCGVGDLITTCFGGRNRRCAEAFARADGKKSWEDIESELLGGQKLQGTLTLLEIVDVLADAPIKKELPLFAAIYRCAFKGAELEEFVKNLNTKQMHPGHAYLVNPYEVKK